MGEGSDRQTSTVVLLPAQAPLSGQTPLSGKEMTHFFLAVVKVLIFSLQENIPKKNLNS